MLNISAWCTKNSIDQGFQSSCDSPILGKMFRAKAFTSWDILEKGVVGEIIFKTENPSKCLMFEHMVRGGMRVGSEL